jgi:hypothetical protein
VNGQELNEWLNKNSNVLILVQLLKGMKTKKPADSTGFFNEIG